LFNGGSRNELEQFDSWCGTLVWRLIRQVDLRTKILSLARRVLRVSREHDDECITKQANTNGGAACAANAKTRARCGASGQASQANHAAGGAARGAANDEICGGGSGAGFVPAVQARMGRYRRENTERARHPFCVPILSGIAPGSGTRARIQEIAARPVGEAAPG